MGAYNVEEYPPNSTYVLRWEIDNHGGIPKAESWIFGKRFWRPLYVAYQRHVPCLWVAVTGRSKEDWGRHVDITGEDFVWFQPGVGYRLLCLETGQLWPKTDLLYQVGMLKAPPDEQGYHYLTHVFLER